MGPSSRRWRACVSSARRPALGPRRRDRDLRDRPRPGRDGVVDAHAGDRAVRAGRRWGGLYVVSLATVAKTYPERIRPRVMALLASMWILPGLLGPPVGAVIAETVGWRWVVRGAAAADRARRRLGDAVAPRCLRERGRVAAAGRRIARADGRRGGPARRAHGPLGVEHPALRRRGRRTIPALRRIVPAGTLTARRGVPAASAAAFLASAAAFLASAAFFAIDGFLTLMLTETRGLSIGEPASC